MKIAITGARGTVGRAVVKLCADEGHHTFQIDRTDAETDGTPNTENRTADIANDYDATVKAFRGADAVIHLAAIPNPVDKDDWKVHNNNVTSAFNAFRAAAELKIKKFCYASSVNAIGLVYSNQSLDFEYFPIDEDYPPKPTDAYALSKTEAELQAEAIVRWFPFMSIASMRIHEVAPLKQVQDEHREDPEGAARNLWGWVSPAAVARACLASVEGDKVKGHEIFNIVAPTTTQSTPSEELARKHFPNAKIKGLSGNQGFWTTDKTEKILGWKHTETE